jgi:hypothetical protein
MSIFPLSGMRQESPSLHLRAAEDTGDGGQEKGHSLSTMGMDMKWTNSHQHRQHACSHRWARNFK